jgi:acid phosphatase
MVDAVEPILRRHRVDLYLAGHDHILELTAKHGVHYVVSGAGAGLDKAGRVRWVDEDTLYAATGGGFAAIRIGRDELVIEFVRNDARTQYAHVIRK